MGDKTDSFRFSPIYPPEEFEPEWSSSYEAQRLTRAISKTLDEIREMEDENARLKKLVVKELSELNSRYVYLQKRLEEFNTLVDEMKELTFQLPDAELRLMHLESSFDRRQAQCENNLEKFKSALRQNRQQFYRRELLKRAKQIGRESITLNNRIDKVKQEVEHRLEIRKSEEEEG